ncbi:efflux RND transporter periplasmic adaptor subunit [Methylotenera mobilis]|uniref:Efflux transporter, RND family, MFP subunit n=1 Tax=Methylotenera mobilis (strain JLW8 / ATCC BAA-1282 / DSM 17540) TaxID=583345 RepID=C6WT57_METML|nr:efflux RND transporter periplasmic adaptor subunit [Methylotenera mobilis]ACT49119.1 efflux transporter, RND family, MFP subunit [Methylotenera mobilis JLW8]
MQRIFSLAVSTLLISILIACGAKDDNASKQDKKNGPKPTLVTVTTVQNTPVEMTEDGIGSLEGLIDPTLTAEVAARIIKVYVSPGDTVKQGQLIASLDPTDFNLQEREAQAEVARIEALLSNQEKTVARNQALVDKKFISQNAVDTSLADQKALKEQLAAAKARINTIRNSTGKTRIFAPTDGVVEKKIVDTGEYVKVGDPIVQIVSNKLLRAYIPFPERVGTQLKAGLKLRLTTPTSSTPIETVIRELKPLITASNRSIIVIADVKNVAGWQAGASVNASVILAERSAAMMVPEQSVVLRPAGQVVYVVKDNQVQQAIVTTGAHQNGLVEITSGLQANDAVVVDGAGFLTDKAPIKIADNSAKP